MAVAKSLVLIAMLGLALAAPAAASSPSSLHLIARATQATQIDDQHAVLGAAQVGSGTLLDGRRRAVDDDRWLAYALATTYHETDQHMQPIEEYGKGRGLPYGKVDPTTGQVYYGRGFVQLTWARNYKTMADLLGVDFLNHPALALELDNATKIMFAGMTKGLFTSKSLGSYFNKTMTIGECAQNHQRLGQSSGDSGVRPQLLLGNKLHEFMKFLSRNCPPLTCSPI